MNPAERQKQNAARMLTYTPFEQELCLSMLGIDVWRRHRLGGLQTSLLLPLHVPVDEFDTYTGGIHQVLERLPQTMRFNTIDAVSALIASATAKLDRVHQLKANMHHCGIDVRRLTEQYGLAWDDMQARWVGELATFILDCVYAHSQQVTGFEPWLATWFELCDAVAGVEHD